VTDSFFGVAVAVDGAAIVVGDNNVNVSGTEMGSAHLFECWTDISTGDEPCVYWNKTHTLHNPGPDYGHFGQAVAIDGSSIVVGAPGSDGKDPSETGPATKGDVFAYRKVGGAWTDVIETTGWYKLSTAGVEGVDYYGGAVDIDNDLIIVGSSGAIITWTNTTSSFNSTTNVTTYGTQVINTTGAGVAYIGVYEWDNTTADWERGTLYAAKPTSEVGHQDNAFFGFSVAVSGKFAIVGEPRRDLTLTHTNIGEAYVFTAGSHGGGLSTGAIIGIVLGALALLLLVGLYVHKRRNSSGPSYSMVESGQSTIGDALRTFLPNMQ
jgi:hypothetical protein